MRNLYIGLGVLFLGAGIFWVSGEYPRLGMAALFAGGWSLVQGWRAWRESGGRKLRTDALQADLARAAEASIFSNSSRVMKCEHEAVASHPPRGSNLMARRLMSLYPRVAPSTLRRDLVNAGGSRMIMFHSPRPCCAFSVSRSNTSAQTKSIFSAKPFSSALRRAMSTALCAMSTAVT